MDWAVLDAAPDRVPVYVEVALLGCDADGEFPVCQSCRVGVHTADNGHNTYGLVEEHVLGRVDDQGRMRVSVTSEIADADFAHDGSRTGIDAAIDAGRAWCSNFEPDRFEVLRDVRDSEISTGNVE